MTETAETWLRHQAEHWRMIAGQPKTITKAIKRKNPHLRQLLLTTPEMEFCQHINESIETDFGKRYYETLVSRLLQEHESDSQSGFLTDFVKRFGNLYLCLSVKSGPHAFNSSSRHKQVEVWQELEKELESCGFIGVFLIGYGRSTKDGQIRPIKGLRHGAYLHGSAFWKFLGSNDLASIMESVLKDPQLDDARFALMESVDTAVRTAKQVCS